MYVCILPDRLVTGWTSTLVILIAPSCAYTICVYQFS